MAEERFERALIVGLGQIGGSFALALSKRSLVPTVRGVDVDPEACKVALERGAVEGTGALLSEVPQADLVVLAVPVRKLLDLVPEVAAALRPGAVLLDTGSTKAAVLAAMGAATTAGALVGGHPMTGREGWGIAAAHEDLFDGATFVVYPGNPAGREILPRVEELLASIGAIPLSLESKRHDRTVAVTSHVPYLLSAALARAASGAAKDERYFLDLVAGGFRGAVRLARSNPEMAGDFCLTNVDPVLAALDKVEAELATLRGLLTSDPDAFRAALREAHDMARAQTERPKLTPSGVG